MQGRKEKCRHEMELETVLKSEGQCSVGEFRLEAQLSSRNGCVDEDDVAWSFNEVKEWSKSDYN